MSARSLICQLFIGVLAGEEERCQEAEEKKGQSAEEGWLCRNDHRRTAHLQFGNLRFAKRLCQDQLSQRNLQQKSIWAQFCLAKEMLADGGRATHVMLVCTESVSAKRKRQCMVAVARHNRQRLPAQLPASATPTPPEYTQLLNKQRQPQHPAFMCCLCISDDCTPSGSGVQVDRHQQYARIEEKARQTILCELNRADMALGMRSDP